ncbi:MAG: AraC family transcriptional regulator [Turicibacter sp.]
MKTHTYFENETVKYLEPIHKQTLDLFLCYCGIEACPSGHSFGPAVRFQYLIHFILKGSGTYHINGKIHHIKQQQGFLIMPDTVTYYEADKEDPWEYVWIGFNGVRAASYLNQANLNEDSLIFDYHEDLKNYVLHMLTLNQSTNANELEIQGLLYLFMSKLIATNNQVNSKEKYKATEIYLEKSIQFIHNNYTNSIKINDIATYIGVNRSYLTHIFKQKLNMSPQEFLLSYRMDTACHLLTYTNLSIGDISRSVGYLDPLAFSKIFRKIIGMSPKKYRESILNQEPQEV